MSLPHKIRSAAVSPWGIALALLGIFVAINGYKFGWDDQHLEIPLLKSLIDGSLYQGDYYVQSLKKNFSSYLYPILARIITIEQIPSAYLFLYLLSRYFFFFWIYKLWLHISGSKYKAVSCVLIFILVLRVHELLYNTFSHQEFALGIIFAGIYYFFRERLLLASFILGLAVNFHALYSLFPYSFIALYLLWQIRKHGVKTLIQSVGIFLLAAAPFLLWVLKTHTANYEPSEMALNADWKQVYMAAAPHNFFMPPVPFGHIASDYKILLNATQRHLIPLLFFILNLTFNPLFRQNKKAIAFCAGAFGLLGVCLVFTYIHPHRFVMDLNLTRNGQYLMFLLGGYTTLLMIDKIQNRNLVLAFFMTVLVTFFKFHYTVTIPTIIILFSLCVIDAGQGRTPKFLSYTLRALSSAVIIACLYSIYQSLHNIEVRLYIIVNLTMIWAFSSALFFWLGASKKSPSIKLRNLFLIIPLSIFFLQYCYYHYDRHIVEREEEGFWRLQRSWKDMQLFVKYNTPKDAVILIPYDLDMDNFRIFSERAVVASYRDSGIIGFDLEAAVEWQRRIAGIKAYKIAVQKSIKEALENGIFKYNADYVVFMRYAAPSANSAVFELIYTNTDLCLFKVIKHPFMDIMRSRQ